MFIDVAYNFYMDSEGQDPDKYSPTLRKYHQILWSKELPTGGRFELTDTSPAKYLSYLTSEKHKRHGEKKVNKCDICEYVSNSIYNYNVHKITQHGSSEEKKEKWIQGAIKHPGALHKELHVPAGEKIPAKRLHAAAKKGGKLGQRARLAETLRGFK